MKKLFLSFCCLFGALALVSLIGCGNQSDERISRVQIIGSEQIKVDLQNTTRYQLVNNPTMVIDTFTGQVWRAAGVDGQYYFLPICFKIKNSKSSQFPNLQVNCD